MHFNESKSRKGNLGMGRDELTNWAGNVRYGTRRVHRPSTLDELRQLVAGADRIRALGTGHSFSRVADAPGELVTLAGLPRTIRIDPDRATVTVAAAVHYGELATHLHAAGFALANLASLPHISVAGACATATHGSGDRLGNLATAVSALRMVTADGTLVDIDRDRAAGLVVGLGALGVVTELTLDLVPAFEIRQYVYTDLPWTRLPGHLAEILGSAYSVSMFTDWTGPRINQVWRKQRLGGGPPEPRWLDATLADRPRHPVAGQPASRCTEQLGVPGPWYARLPHFRPEFAPSSGAELQSEYLVPRRHALAALAEIYAIRTRVAPVLQICEIRSVAADELWLSPSYRRDSVAIHFTWIADVGAVTPVLTAVEERLAPLSVRPHWGKLFAAGPETVRGQYERWRDFAALRRRYDPTGTFGNAFVDRYLPSG
jgi:xylitol oxidase